MDSISQEAEFKAPIFILAFNRPDYLESVATSLRQQKPYGVENRQIFLIQDGGFNFHSQRRYCDDQQILRNVDVVRSILPNCIPVVSYQNLGIAMNFDRAERLAFESIQAEAAIFLEDDLVLGPYYIHTLDKLISLALQNERIGYVAAYGNYKASKNEQEQHLTDLMLLGHNWGFGLTRRQWLRQKPFVDQYLDIVRGCDYRQRNHDQIIDLFHSWGLGAPGTSQDIAKTHACILTDAGRFNTFACFGKYIGEKGVHFNEATFKNMGFGDTYVVEDDAFHPTNPTDLEIDGNLRLLRKSYSVNTVVRKAPINIGDNAESTNLLQQIQELRSTEKWDEAYEVCARGLRLYPNYRDSYGHPVFLKERFRLCLLNSAALHKEVKAVISQLESVLPPNDPCCHVLLARHFTEIGEMSMARREWEMVRKIDPKNAEAQEGLIVSG